jgi:hypothetical protein
MDYKMFIQAKRYGVLEAACGLQVFFEKIIPRPTKIANIINATRVNSVSTITLNRLIESVSKNQRITIAQSTNAPSDIIPIPDSFIGDFTTTSSIEVVESNNLSLTFDQNLPNTQGLSGQVMTGDLYKQSNIAPSDQYLIQFFIETKTPSSAEATVNPSSYIVGGYENFIPSTVLNVVSRYSKSVKILLKMVIKDYKSNTLLRTEYQEIIVSDASSKPCEIIYEKPIDTNFYELNKKNNWSYFHDGYLLAEFIPDKYHKDIIIKLIKKNNRLLPNRSDKDRIRIIADPIKLQDKQTTIDKIRNAVLDMYGTISNSIAIANLGNKSYDIIVENKLAKPEDFQDLIVDIVPPVTGTNIKFSEVATAENYTQDLASIPKISILKWNNYGIGELHYNSRIYDNDSILVNISGDITASLSGTISDITNGVNYLSTLYIQPTPTPSNTTTPTVTPTITATSTTTPTITPTITPTETITPSPTETITPTPTETITPTPTETITPTPTSTELPISINVVVHDESRDGPLSNSPNSPTSVFLISGNSRVVGSVGGNSDYFNFQIDSNHILNSISLVNYVSLDSIAWIGIQSGLSWTAGDNPNLMLDQQHFGSDDINNNILTNATPLSSGVYVIRIQQLGSEALYNLNFELVAAPTSTPTITPTITSTPTTTLTVTPTNTISPSLTPTNTITSTQTPTNTPTLTTTPTPTTSSMINVLPTVTPTITPTSSLTNTPTITLTTTPTITPSVSSIIFRTSNTANYNNCASWDNLSGNVTSVGTNGKGSSYGIHDMNGNVWEWTERLWNAGARGVKGGSWNSIDNRLLRTYEGIQQPTTVLNQIGFRVGSFVLNNLNNFIVISDSENINDDSGIGNVDYIYSIGRFLVTNSEYAEFLNNIAALDTFEVYDINMNGNRGGIIRSGISGSYIYTVKNNYQNKPVVFVNWYNAARYCNWLHNSKPTGNQNNSTTENGAYQLTGNTNSPNRTINAQFFIPNGNEWQKAAFYKAGGTSSGYWNYATASDSLPTCVLSNSLGNGI